jgi:hypothetical protein
MPRGFNRASSDSIATRRGTRFSAARASPAESVEGSDATGERDDIQADRDQRHRATGGPADLHGCNSGQNQTEQPELSSFTLAERGCCGRVGRRIARLGVFCGLHSRLPRSGHPAVIIGVRSASGSAKCCNIHQATSAREIAAVRLKRSVDFTCRVSGPSVSRVGRGQHHWSPDSE